MNKLEPCQISKCLEMPEPPDRLAITPGMKPQIIKARRKEVSV